MFSFPPYKLKNSSTFGGQACCELHNTPQARVFWFYTIYIVISGGKLAWVWGKKA